MVKEPCHLYTTSKKTQKRKEDWGDSFLIWITGKPTWLASLPLSPVGPVVHHHLVSLQVYIRIDCLQGILPHFLFTFTSVISNILASKVPVLFLLEMRKLRSNEGKYSSKGLTETHRVLQLGACDIMLL
jgi:hypothetical protein